MSSAFPNEPSGFAPIFDVSFNQFLPSGVLDVYNSALYVSDGTAPLSGPYVMDVMLAANASSGGVQLNATFPTRPRELFAGFWIKTNAGFQGYGNSNNKVIFLRGPSSGDNSVLVWQGAQDAPKTLKWYQQGVVNNTHVPGVFGTNYPIDGTGWFDPNVNAGVATFSAGSGWHKCEIRLKASTTNTSRDGVIQIWVDGTLSTSHFNVNLSSGGFDDWVITPTWDGQSSATCAFRDCSREWHWYWDHLYVSAPGTTGATPTLSGLSPSTFSLSPGSTQTITASMSAAVTSTTSIALSSSNPSAITVPSSVNVSTGQSSASFTATGVAAGSSTINAFLSAVSRTSVGTVTSTGGGGGGGTASTYTFASQYSGTQGQNQWSYRDTAGNLLTYNSGANKWEGDELYLAIFPGGFVHGYTGSKKGAVLRWTAPANGTVAITGTASLYVNPAFGTFSVTYNSSTSLFSQVMSVSTSYPYSLNQSVSTGDVIDFVITGTSSSTNNNTQLDPVIVFTTASSNPLAPTISSFTPTSGTRGTSVTVVGANFSGTIANNIVTVNGTLATVTSASPTQLVFTVPQAATTGAVMITTSTGSVTGSTFTVTDPVTPDIPPAANFGGNAFLLLAMP